MNTKQKILQTALKLFNTKGFHEVGVREIARTLGISPGNLSYHFPKKEYIFFELIKQYSQNNDIFFRTFFSSEATLENFLILMRNLLKAQYKNRGLFLAHSFITNEIKTKDRINYFDTNQRRNQGLKKILERLQYENQIKTDSTDIEFLISFLTLFGRFSIQEAFMLHKKRKEAEILQHYLKMLTKQMYLFATTKGRASINKFKSNFLIDKKNKA